MSRIHELARLLDRHTSALGSGMHESAIPRLEVIRADRPSEKTPSVYRPCVCIIAQGAKRSIAGDSVLNYGPGYYLTVSVDVPVVAEIVTASEAEPYLCLKIDLDLPQLSDLAIESGLSSRTDDDEPAFGLAVSAVSREMLDAVNRLLGLLDRPEAIAALAPLYERELLYFLLTGAQGQRLRQIVRAESRTGQIVKAIRWIATRFREPITIEDAAAQAGMSASSFHQHFKAVTALSPLQYQKQLRLQEARRLLVSSGSDAASASFAVGYASPQQFSREYARLFGSPPQRDAARLRAGANGVAIAAEIAASA
jgi:AraC-like DNA-binding protein